MLWDVAKHKFGPFNDLVMFKNTQIFAKSYNFEGPFNRLYVGHGLGWIRSIFRVKVMSKWRQFSPKATILKVFLISYILAMVWVRSDQVSESLSW